RRPTRPRNSAVARAAVAGTDLAGALERDGYALLPGLLAPEECRALAALYDERERFRSRVVYPLLAPVANRWQQQLRLAPEFPGTLDAYLAHCHAAGQVRPTPLILKYGAGDYNCLHQDLYGELVFPLQATVLLSRPGADFAGGEFMLVETRPRMQSKGEGGALAEGDAGIFPVNQRPGAAARGLYRTAMRHGVSRLHSGRRFTLGIIFHDAA